MYGYDLGRKMACCERGDGGKPFSGMISRHNLQTANYGRLPCRPGRGRIIGPANKIAAASGQKTNIDID
jgi:hypothetical protein